MPKWIFIFAIFIFFHLFFQVLSRDIWHLNRCKRFQNASQTVPLGILSIWSTVCRDDKQYFLKKKTKNPHSISVCLGFILSLQILRGALVVQSNRKSALRHNICTLMDAFTQSTLKCHECVCVRARGCVCVCTHPAAPEVINLLTKNLNRRMHFSRQSVERLEARRAPQRSGTENGNKCDGNNSGGGG